MTLPPIDQKFLVEFLTGLLNKPSPTGFSEMGMDYVRQALISFPELDLSLTHKGALLATLSGLRQDQPRALTAHVDTLGAMVKEIKSNGRLKLTQIGGYSWNAIEGEGCTVYTHAGNQLRGSILLDKASSHVFGGEVSESKRDEKTMEVRLDIRSNSPGETRAVGIQVGDFVSLDPRVEVVNGFIRSRHLDDKAGVAILVTAVKALHEAGLKPAQKSYFFISNYEEVGHGAAAGIPPEVTELLVVDMAAVGNGQTSDEFHATLCVKDSHGPYHYGMSQRLRRLADTENIPYQVDIYPYYGSDGGAFWRAGGDVAEALIGPGVDASHNYERTHLDALVATTQWVLAYLLN